MNLKEGNRTKEFQDFFTPDKIAEDLYKQYEPLLKKIYKGKRLKILEPAVGSGNLIWPLLASKYKVDITVMDIQQDYLDALQGLAKDKGYKVKIKKDGLIHIKN